MLKSILLENVPVDGLLNGWIKIARNAPAITPPIELVIVLLDTLKFLVFLTTIPFTLPETFAYPEKVPVVPKLVITLPSATVPPIVKPSLYSVAVVEPTTTIPWLTSLMVFLIIVKLLLPPPATAVAIVVKATGPCVELLYIPNVFW